MKATDNIPCDSSRFLIVDDDAGVLQVFYRVLSYWFPNKRIDVAVNGREAVDAFTLSHQAIVLMDLRMPVMTGDTAFREIEKACRAEMWEVPSVIFCTGFAPPSIISELVADHPEHGLLVKPVTNDVLIEEFKSRLEHAA